MADFTTLTETLTANQDQPKVPTISYTALQEVMDEDVGKIKTYINDTLIASLNNDGSVTTSGAELLGSKSISGVSGTKVHTQITDLKTQIDLKAVDAEVVKLAGTQTIPGAKTFEDITVPVLPVNDTDPSSKKYVDDTAISGVGDGSVTNAKLATDIKHGSNALLSTTDQSSTVNAINELVDYNEYLLFTSIRNERRLV